MRNKVLNITNGDYFNDYFLSKNGGEAVPFREVMMDGEADLDIYSDEFIMLRSVELHVSIEEYKAKTLLNKSLISNYSTLCLWFGRDTFCQMNLLMLLAYLERIEYGGEVFLNIIDDETFDIMEKGIAVELGIYQKIYCEVLMSRVMPKEYGVISKGAIELYFDYHSNGGALARIVRENRDKTDKELLCLLLENSKEYGLSDIQAEKLIRKYRKGKNND